MMIANSIALQGDKIIVADIAEDLVIYIMTLPLPAIPLMVL